MELEKLMLRESPTPLTSPRMKLKSPQHSETYQEDGKSAKEIVIDGWSHLSRGGWSPSEPFKKLDMGVPMGESAESRLTWLHSQIIGGDAVFDSPFGVRRLTYADHTASGRCLRYAENFIADNVLPFYGKSQKQDHRFNSLHGAFVASLLNDLFGIQARAGCACAGPYGHTLLGVNETNSLAIRSYLIIIGLPWGETGMDQNQLPLLHGRRGIPLHPRCARVHSQLCPEVPLTGPISTKNMNSTWVSNNMKHDKGGPTPTEMPLKEYASYFDQARHIAGLLPKFPPPRSLKEDVDLDLLYFRA